MATVEQFVDRSGGATTDTGRVRAIAIANAWARRELGRRSDDELLDLDELQTEAVLGFAADVLKLPKASFGMFDTGNEIAGLQAIGLDIGRRWRHMLVRVTATDAVGGMA